MNDLIRAPQSDLHTSHFIRNTKYLSRTKGPTRSRKRQRGFDLIQLALVVALIGMLMSGALVGVPRLIDSIKTGQQADDIRVFATQVQGNAAMYPEPEITAAVLHGFDVYPLGQGSVSGTTINYAGRLNSDVVVMKVEKQRSLTVTLSVPTPASCQKLVREVGPLARAIKIAGKDVERGTNSRFNNTAISTSCQAADGEDAGREIIFTIDI
ncbi:MAG: hypothetical protein ACRYHA_08475 [Janthinobacterium lividum]